MKKNKVITFGCRLNSWESSKIEREINNLKNNNLIVINTCTVTNEATKEARKKIKKLYRLNPNKKIVVTGCAVESDYKSFSKMPEIHTIIRNLEKLNPASWKKLENKFDDNSLVTEQNISLLKVNNYKSNINPSNSKYRRYVRIQTGCNHACTFCIIPSCRGQSKSNTLEEIIRDIKQLVNNGTIEIILTGVDLTSWGQDLIGKPTLGYLVKNILSSCKKLKRLRLSSIDAAEIDDELLESIAKDYRLMPHLHFSLQSHNDLILKRMKRRHLSKSFEELLLKIKNNRKDITIGADFIVGFPTETEEMFQDSLRSLEKLNITHLHVFPYSEKSGTIAARMPQIPIHIRRERSALMRKEGIKIKLKNLKKELNTPQKILVENSNGFGRTENNFMAKVDKGLPGEILSFIPMAVKDNVLIGKKI